MNSTWLLGTSHRKSSFSTENVFYLARFAMVPTEIDILCTHVTSLRDILLWLGQIIPIKHSVQNL